MKAEGQAEAGHVDLTESDAAGRGLDITAYQEGEAVGEAEFGAGREVDGCEKIAGLVRIGNFFNEKVSGVVKIIVVAAVLPVEEVRGSAGADKKERVVAGVEVPAEVQGDLEHSKSPFYIAYAAGHSHAIIAIVTIRDVVVLWKCCKDFPGEE